MINIYLALVAFIALYFLSYSTEQTYVNDIRDPLHYHGSYGGTAGLLLANRLALTTSQPTILVIEAGKDRSDLIYRNPADRFSLVFTNPELDHGYKTVPQEGLGGRQLPYARGKGLGGSTLTNFMIYLSGSREDYDYWAELVGDDTWKWENSHRRLQELETFHGGISTKHKHVANPSLDGHGRSGSVDVGIPATWETGATDIILEAAKYGISTNLDMNSGNPLGMGMAPVSAADGYRTTSASAHLKSKPGNLIIWTETVVKKVVIEGMKAVAVELLDGSKAFAQREIILTAGSFETPKILMLSGIGHRDELTVHGIETIQHLPGIGKSLKDHAAVFLTALMKPGLSTRSAFETDPEAVTKATEQWKLNGTGEFTVQYQSLPIMFNKLPSLYETTDFKQLPANTQNYLLRSTVPTYEAAFNGPKFPPFLEVPTGHEYFGFTVFGMNPQSSGTVKLATSNPTDLAIVDSGTLTHPFDRRVMIDSLIDVLKFFKTSDFYKKYFVSWLVGPISEARSDIEKFLEEQTILVWHANGTVKMGKSEEKETCVNTDFRVLGIDNLRVADMSISPLTINGHTQAVAYLIGATAAEKLIGEYKL